MEVLYSKISAGPEEKEHFLEFLTNVHQFQLIPSVMEMAG
jgi:hypothetical protein